MIAAVALLGFVTAERAAELFLARRNTHRLLEGGAQEAAAAHYPLIVALHAAWLLGLWLLAWNQPVQIVWLLLFAVTQGLRVWVILTLGERWTTRIIVLPGAPLVASGPYRYLRHPKYAVVAAEIALLPLVFGLVWYALAFSVLNALMLWIRIMAEDAALKGASNKPANSG